jgi:hypothetical protein
MMSTARQNTAATDHARYTADVDAYGVAEADRRARERAASAERARDYWRRIQRETFNAARGADYYQYGAPYGVTED